MTLMPHPVLCLIYDPYALRMGQTAYRMEIIFHFKAKKFRYENP